MLTLFLIKQKNAYSLDIKAAALMMFAKTTALKPSWPPHYLLFGRISFVVILGGVCFLSLQIADVYLLQSFGPQGAGLQAMGMQPVAYVPVAATNAEDRNEVSPLSPYAGLTASELKIAEVGDGGDLGRRAAAILRSFCPYVLAQQKNNTIYVPLQAVLDYLGGDLIWAEDQPMAYILLPAAFISFAPGQKTAFRNYKPISLPAPIWNDDGQWHAPLQTLRLLYDWKMETGPEGRYYKLSFADKKLFVIVRQNMYSLEISRSERYLQVYFLGEPVKRYPVCVGAGNNTPVGHFHIQNKAVWPPWHAYWGEYMPGGSRRNPLGARWLGTTARGHATGRVIGIHGTNQPSSIGQRISGGCIRMYNKDAIELYNNIPLGTPVWIHE